MRGFCRLLVHLWDKAARKWEGQRRVGVSECRRIGEEKQSVRSIQVDETYATFGTHGFFPLPAMSAMPAFLFRLLGRRQLGNQAQRSG